MVGRFSRCRATSPMAVAGSRKRGQHRRQGNETAGPNHRMPCVGQGRGAHQSPGYVLLEDQVPPGTSTRFPRSRSVSPASWAFTTRLPCASVQTGGPWGAWDLVPQHGAPLPLGRLRLSLHPDRTATQSGGRGREPGWDPHGPTLLQCHPGGCGEVSLWADCASQKYVCGVRGWC